MRSVDVKRRAAHASSRGFQAAFLLAAFMAGISDSKAQADDASCIAVIDAINQLRKQPWVVVRGQVTQGVHPDGYTAMTSLLLAGRKQIRILDGKRFSSNRVMSNQDELDRVTGATELTPDSDCVPVLAADSVRADTGSLGLVEYTYSTKVARAEAHFRIGISPGSGLPIRVLVNGPQLAYGRSLSRPGKPPQVTLRTNGLRYTELLEYSYDEGVVRAAARLQH